MAGRQYFWLWRPAKSILPSLIRWYSCYFRPALLTASLYYYYYYYDYYYYYYDYDYDYDYYYYY